MKNSKEKSYYLKDAALNTVDDDFFRHQDVTNNIIKILETTKPPFNIAVIGKWGLGKSSLINMVSSYINSSNSNCMKIEINAWKYEKEVLAKVFLRQVKQGLFPDEQKKTSVEQFRESIIGIKDGVKNAITHPINYAKNHLTKNKKSHKNYIASAGLYIMFSFAIYAIYKLMDINLSSMETGSFFWTFVMIVTGYIKNMGTIIFAPLLLILLTQICEEMKKSNSDLELKVPALGVEDYEIYLDREIARKLDSLSAEERENFKIVIVLDDLDRLSVPKMVEALDAIKMFIDFKNCVFIVPFDDEILKNAIEKKRLNPMDNNEIQGELLLDKLFQYKVYLPQLLKHDIKQYSENLCKEQIPDFVKEYMNNDWALFNDILRHILIHNDVETPRQVKKVVNAFVSNMMVAKGRQDAGNTENGFATDKDSIKVIAKLSVLQSDFNQFYDLLFIEDNAIELLMDVYNGKIEIIQLPVEMRKYLGLNEKSKGLPNNILPLINFLISTNRYKPVSILPYLYMAMDDVSIKTGSKKQQDFRKALVSRNFIAVREQLEDNPRLIDVGSYILTDENDIVDITSAFITIINMFDLLQDRRDILVLLCNACDEVVTYINNEDEKLINYQNMLEIYKVLNSDEKCELEKLIIYCMRTINANLNMQEKTDAFMANYKIYDPRVIDNFHNYIYNVLTDKHVNIEEFIESRRKHQVPLNEKWAMAYYKYLIDSIEEDDNILDLASAELETVYKEISTPETANDNFLMFEKIFGVCKLSQYFVQILSLDVSKQIPISTTSLLIEKQIEAELTLKDSNKSQNIKVNPLLLYVQYEVNETNSEIYDDYISLYIKKKEFVELLDNYVKENNVAYIDNAICTFINYIFENISQETANMLANCIDYFNEVQISNINKNISSEITYSSSKTSYAPIENIIDIYSKNEVRFVQLQSKISDIISYMSSRTVDEDYIEYILTCIKPTISKFDKSLREDLFKMITKKGDAGYLTELSINKVCDMREYVPDDVFTELSEMLCTHATSVTYYSVHKFLDAHWEIISKQDDRTNYLKIAVGAMKDEAYVNIITQKLGVHFPYIEKEYFEKLLVRLMNSKDVKMNVVVPVIAKFIDNMKLNIVSNTLMSILLNEGYDNKLYEFYSHGKINTFEGIVNNILSVTGEYTVENICLLLEFIIKYETSSFNGKIYELFKSCIYKANTEDQNSEIIDILYNMDKSNYRNYSKEYAPIYETLVKNTSSVENRKKLASKARDIRIHKYIKEKLDENLRRVWENL